VLSENVFLFLILYFILGLFQFLSILFTGAGKTTTFNMLTGDIRPSSGTALITGYDITTDIRKVEQ